jgi:hypothetical protein
MRKSAAIITHTPRDTRHQVRRAARRTLLDRVATAGAEQALLLVGGEQRTEVFLEAPDGRRDEDALELERERVHDAALQLDADARRWRFYPRLELRDERPPLAPPAPRRSPRRAVEVARRIDDNAVAPLANGAVGGIVDVATAHDEQRKRQHLGLGAAARLRAPPCR